MARRKQAKRFDHVPEITEEHGKRFADELVWAWGSGTGAIFMAMEETKIMSYPTDEDVPYQLVEAEGQIADLIGIELRDQIAEAFQKAAAKVLGLQSSEGVK